MIVTENCFKPPDTVLTFIALSRILCIVHLNYFVEARDPGREEAFEEGLDDFAADGGLDDGFGVDGGTGDWMVDLDDLFDFCEAELDGLEADFSGLADNLDDDREVSFGVDGGTGDLKPAAVASETAAVSLSSAFSVSAGC